MLRVSPRELIVGFSIQSFSILISLFVRNQVLIIFREELKLSQFPWNAYLCFTSLVAIVFTVIPTIIKSIFDSYKRGQEENRRKQEEVQIRTDEKEIMRG